MSEDPSTGGGVHPTADELPALAGASNVLVMGPTGSEADRSLCRSILTRHSIESTDVLVVSLTRSASDRIQTLEGDDGDLPANVTVVSPRDRVDATTTTERSDVDGLSTTITVETVTDPSDLPRLGMAISGALGEWDEGGGTEVCFDSLTALLQYADRRRVFQFVQVLQNRTEEIGGATHYHMDPEAHDDRTIATMRPLFDAIVELSTDGEPTVRHQR